MPLILALRLGEKIYIDGGRVTIFVNEIHENMVRLGFDADVSIPIVRSNAVNKSPKPRPGKDSNARRDSSAR